VSIWAKLLILIFPVVSYALPYLVFWFFNLKKYTTVRVRDIWTLFLMFGLNHFLSSATNIASTPYYALILSGMGLSMLALHLFVYRKFSYPKFFKRFWRATYLVTLAMYLSLIIAAFLLK
jgi:hypothetical protein